MISDDQVKLLEQSYYREKQARKDAESILENKTRELYEANAELKKANETLSQQQAQLIKTEKLVALGTLSAGVAHEINNPLAFVISNINALKRYCDGYIELTDSLNPVTDSLSETTRDELNKLAGRHDIDYIINDTRLIFSEVDSGLDRVREIVSNLKSFSRTQPGDRKYDDPNDAVRMALKLLENELKYKCQLQVSLEELPSVYCNINELSQVFLNIIINASHAIVGQGDITVKSWFDCGVHVSIEDSGKGMSQETMTQIFDPFFTNKPLGMGTGLGLSVSFGIVEDLGGEIKVESELKKGSKFTVFLPAEQRVCERAE